MGSSFPDLLAPKERETDRAAAIGVQSCGFVLELSSDWLVQRASENTHQFLGQYPPVLAGEPLTAYTLAQPLHDLRNSLSRQRGAGGIARAYRVRLIAEPRYFDIAFQQIGDRILLEGVPSAEAGFGAALGSVSRLIDGLDDARTADFLANAARRMRALTGFDHVQLRLAGGDCVESSRDNSSVGLTASDFAALPPLLVDTAAKPVPIFPRGAEGASRQALLRAPADDLRERLRGAEIRSALKVPLMLDGEPAGSFVCTNRAAAEPGLELHAAVELFAQFIAMRLRMDRSNDR